jgi:bisanhydrobacterioruberin hydratase
MKSENRTIALLILLFLIGIILHIPCILRDYILYTTTPFLFFIGILLVIKLLNNSLSKTKLGVFLALSFFTLLSIEIIAVKTGKIFGNYTYGNTIWLKLANVPLVIGLYWLILILASHSISKWTADFLYIKSHNIQVFLAGMYLVILDYFMEPVAMQLNYWNWNNGYIPVRNYFAWFLICVVQLYLLKFLKLEISGKLLSALYLIMLLYFMCLQVFLYPC